MDRLLVLGALQFANYLYQKYLKTLTIVDLDYVVTQDNIRNEEICLDLDLNNHLKLKSEYLIILNPTIHVTLPLKVFPVEEDYLGFEYELMTVDRHTLKQFKETIIIRIQLFDTVVK